MTQNLWLRSHEIAQWLGLLSGTIALYYLGLDLENIKILFFSAVSGLFFAILLCYSVYCLFRDIIKHPDKMR